MGVNNTLCQLGSVLAEWERDTVSIRSVTVSDEGGSGDSTEAEVALEAPLADGDSETVVDCTPSVTANGTLGITVETGLSVPGDEVVSEVTPVDVALQRDGVAEVTVSLTLEDHDGYSTALDTGNHEGESTTSDATEATGPQLAESTETTQNPSRARNRDVAPFEDSELLQEVYDTHDTFAEMAEALDMDVTGETVRRYMIDHDIHQPNSYRTESPETTDGAVAEEEMVVLSDGLGLPESVEVEDLIDTVNRANTIYEVKEDLDMERMEAHSMLKDLNLVDLVMGRLSNDRSCDITREDVIDRLRETSKARET